MKVGRYVLITLGLLFALQALAATLAWTPLAVSNDPLVRMPGT